VLVRQECTCWIEYCVHASSIPYMNRYWHNLMTGCMVLSSIRVGVSRNSTSDSKAEEHVLVLLLETRKLARSSRQKCQFCAALSFVKSFSERELPGPGILISSSGRYFPHLSTHQSRATGTKAPRAKRRNGPLALVRSFQNSSSCFLPL